MSAQFYRQDCWQVMRDDGSGYECVATEMRGELEAQRLLKRIREAEEGVAFKLERGVRMERVH